MQLPEIHTGRHTERWPSTVEALWLAVACSVAALAYALRLRDLNTWGFWYDEGHSILVANKPLDQLFATLANDVHPPLYFLALRLGQQFFGDSEFALRWLSVACGVGTVALIGKVALMLVDRRAALAASLLATASPLLLYASQEARMYSGAALLVCLAAVLLVVAWRRDRLVAWLGLMAAEAAAVYTHYYTILPLLVLGLAAALAVVWGGWRRQRVVAAWLASQVGAVLLFLPWLPTALAGLQRYGSDWLPNQNLEELTRRSWLSLNFGPWPLLAEQASLPYLAGGLAALATFIALVSRRSRLVTVAAVLWLALGLGVVTYAALQRPMYHPRYLVQLAPAYCLILGAGFSRVRPWLLAPGLVGMGLVIAAFGVGIGNGLAAAHDDARGVARYLAEVAGPQDLVLIDTDSPFRYYGRTWQAPYIILPDEPPNDARYRERLNQAAVGRAFVYHVRWLESSHDAKEVVSFYLRSQAEWLGQRDFPGFEVDVYRVGDLSAFAEPRCQGVAYGFEGPVALVGAGIGPGRDLVGKGQIPSVVAGGLLPATLRWQVAGRVGQNLSALLVMVDERGAPVGQVGRDLVNSAHVFSARWNPGEESTNFYLLPVPEGTPPGEYRLQAILHLSGGGRRLDILDAAGRPQGTEVDLGRVNVVSPTAAGRANPQAPTTLAHDFGPLQLVSAAAPTGPAKPGDRLSLALRWRAAERPARDLQVKITLRFGADGPEVAISQGAPAYGLYPTTAWSAGELVSERRELALPLDLAAGPYQVQVSLVDGAGQELPAHLVGTLVVVEPERSYVVPPVSHSLGVRFGQAIELLGFDVSAPELGRTRPVRLTLYWRCLGAVAANYTTFTHLLGPGDVVWGQQDSPPLGGARPTAGWAKGEVLSDVYDLTLRPGAPVASYLLEVGLYDARMMERLPVLDANGQPADNRALLLRLELRE